MELQIALDRIPLAQAIEITAVVASQADWIEVGTSLIKRYGTIAVAEIVATAGGTPVLADLKTADDAAHEFGLAYDAGASSATVLGVATGATIDAAVRVAADRSLEVVVDLLATTQDQRSALAAHLPDSVVFAAHVPKDAQTTGTSPQDLLGPWAQGRRVALAGGLRADDIAALAHVDRLRVVVGSAITRAPDPAHALAEVRAAMSGSAARLRPASTVAVRMSLPRSWQRSRPWWRRSTGDTSSVSPTPS